jgi:hypothetical protein
MALSVRTQRLCCNLNFKWSYLLLQLSHECGFFRKIKVFDLRKLTWWQGFKAETHSLNRWAFSQCCKFWEILWVEVEQMGFFGDDGSWFVGIWSQWIGRHGGLAWDLTVWFFSSWSHQKDWGYLRVVVNWRIWRHHKYCNGFERFSSYCRD